MARPSELSSVAVAGEPLEPPSGEFSAVESGDGIAEAAKGVGALAVPAYLTIFCIVFLRNSWSNPLGAGETASGDNGSSGGGGGVIGAMHPSVRRRSSE
ncbi:hypothetical protein PINS_up002493 [Pythium insidiosum]|nr:hypothetical protein PINS_up002493 [Pythium insidiosum]